MEIGNAQAIPSGRKLLHILSQSIQGLDVLLRNSAVPVGWNIEEQIGISRLA